MSTQINPTRIGIDIGFGDTKLARLTAAGRISTLTFASIVGRAETHTAADVGLGSTKKNIQTIEYNGEAYFIGEGAIVESRLASTRQDQSRIGSIEEKVLLLAALNRAKITDALIVTGLPVLWWNERKTLVKSWKGTHKFKANGKPQTVTIREVRPVWQPLGSFYTRFLHTDGTANTDEQILMRGFGIIDIGMNTTDLTGLDKLQPVGKWTAGVRVGVRDALEVISADIEKRFQVRRDLIELSVDLRKTGTTTLWRTTYTMDQIGGSALKSLGQRIVSETTRQWGQGDRFHTVLITGGGAALVGDHVKAAFPHNAEILKNPGEANAIGFAKFAQRKIFRSDRK